MPCSRAQYFAAAFNLMRPLGPDLSITYGRPSSLMFEFPRLLSCAACVPSVLDIRRLSAHSSQRCRARLWKAAHDTGAGVPSTSRGLLSSVVQRRAQTSSLLAVAVVLHCETLKALATACSQRGHSSLTQTASLPFCRNTDL